MIVALNLKRRGLGSTGPFIVFALLGLNVAVWFRDGLPIGYGDSGFFQFFHNPGYLTQAFRWMWDANELAGHPAPQRLSLLPLAYFFAGGRSIGLSAASSQAVWYWIIQFGSMSSMYLLLKRQRDGTARWRIASMVGAIAYAFNPMIMHYWYNGTLGVSVVLLLPMFLLVIEYSLHLRLAWAALAAGLVLFINAAALSNPAFALPVFLLGGAFMAFRAAQLYSKHREIYRRVLSAFLGLGLGSLMNAWWLGPLILGGANYWADSQVTSPLLTLTQSSRFTSPLSLLRLVPYDADAALWAYKYPPWRLSYGQWYMWGITVLIWAIMLLAVFNRRRDRFTLFASCTTAAGIILSLGTNSALFGRLYLWLFKNLPYFSVFRSPTDKFAVIVGFGFGSLFALGVFAIRTAPRHLSHRSRWTHAVLSGLLVGVLSFYVYPMWTGAVVDGPITIRGTDISAKVAVPPDYAAVASFLNQQAGSFRVLALPLRDGTTVSFDWKHGYDGPDATWLLIRHPVLSYLGHGVEGSDAIRRASARSLTDVIEVAGSQGVRYVLVQGDVRVGVGGVRFPPPYVSESDVTVDGPTRSPAFTRWLEAELSALGLRKVLGAGDLSLYEVPRTARRPMIYSPDHLVAISSWDQWQTQSPRALPAQLAKSSDDSESADAVLGSDGAIDSLPYLGVKAATVKNVSASGTTWTVNIERAEHPFFLTLNQAFDPGWEATVVEAKARDPRSPEWAIVAHTRTNNFGNTWFIRGDSDVPMDLTVTLRYSPQRAVGFGQVASAASMLITVIAYVYRRRASRL